jgi:catechol 2,3-dioxygenase-like lactoylglutathione lyase family enzyme
VSLAKGSIVLAVTEFFAGMPVADFEAAVAWYERLWGREPDFFPEPGEAVWQITEHAWVYVVTDADRAGNGLITVLVDDLDERVTSLKGQGIEVGPIQEMGPSVPGFALTDPEGNRITFGQPPTEPETTA